ncbi:MAG: hypothetical protein QM778_27640 [Myxococcales bacterium]
MVSEQGARRGSGDEGPYQGALGRTRAETVQVWMPDGKVRALSVYVGVDRSTDAGLATLARSGALHHVAEGVALAVPFVFHDPAARMFLLVVPEALRHQALALRAQWMTRLASDSEHAVPSYVRDVEVVIGHQALAARLDGTLAVSTAELPDPALWSAARSEALEEREREIARRERVLALREEALRVPSRAVEDTELEEVDDDSTLAYERAVVEAELEGNADDEFESVDAAAEDEHVVDDADDQVEEVEDIEAESVAVAEDDGSYDDDLDAVAGESTTVSALVIDDRRLFAAPGIESIGVAPEAFVNDPEVQLFLSCIAGRVWLFVRGRPPFLPAGAELELLVQIDPSADVLVPLVTLVFDTMGSPEVRRGVVDCIDPEQREALRALGRAFVVELVSWSPDGSLDHWATLEAPREANARAIVAALEDRPELSPARFRGAGERLLAAPPAWRDLTHPFQSDRDIDPPLTATEAAVLLDELSDWLTPERRERVRLSLCVPDEVVDERTVQSLNYALDWGLALPPLLAERALALGVAADEASLLMRRIAGLTRTSREVELGGLEATVLHRMWSEALEQAARLGVPLSEDALGAAKLHGGERAQVHADALAPSHDPDLEPLREELSAAEPDPAVLSDLMARGGYRDLIDACRASERLSPEAAARLFAQAARRPDSVAADALLSMLTLAEPLRVRAGAALALAERRSSVAIDELALRVANESDDDWPIFARALGRYGAGSFRAIARALTEHAVPDERSVLVLAHLALHGARSQVRAKTRVEDAHEAQLATRALTVAGELKGGKNPGLGLEQQAALTVFSELFDRSPRDAV